MYDLSIRVSIPRITYLKSTCIIHNCTMAPSAISEPTNELMNDRHPINLV